MPRIYPVLKDLLDDLIRECPTEMSDEELRMLIIGLNKGYDRGTVDTLRKTS